MSPRSEEFLEGARGRLVAARASLEAGIPPAAISAAYYGMLYAARAALSERDRYAKTHSGTWSLFHQTFVATGAFDQALHSEAARTQELREQVDYEAEVPPEEEARTVIDTGSRFVDAVAAMLSS